MADVQSTGGLLSYLNVSDPLLRAELFREIRLAQTDASLRNPEEWAIYEIQPGDVLFPELIAYKAYSLDTLKWVVMVAAGLDDPRERLEAGTELHLPSNAWIRRRIRHYAELAEV